MISKRTLKIGWNNSKVEEYTTVKRCFKCCGFNHSSNECKNKLSCLRCGKGHRMIECTSNTIECVNCSTVSKKYKLNLDLQHTANSRDCYVFKRKLEIERKKIEFAS